LDIPSTACFEAQYAPKAGEPEIPAREDTFTTLQYKNDYTKKNTITFYRFIICIVGMLTDYLGFSSAGGA
jgi:hypothetical protein